MRLSLGFAVSVILLANAITACWSPNGASGGDEHAVSPALIEPPPGPDASTGTVEIFCGRNEEGHNNNDNLIASPGAHDGAHHTHDYVGNLSTNAFSTDASLAAAATTCTNGDRSVYYWPVLRLLDGQDGGVGSHQHGDHNDGTIVKPSSVRITFRGSSVSPVVAMPRFLRASTGDARAVTNGPQPFARVQWGCSEKSERLRDRYPQCPAGEQITRLFDFPSCWNGLTSDSESHRTHIVFPADNGVCQNGFFAVPALRIELAYDLPSGRRFAIDAFPGQHRSARTDHSDFINVMTDEQMAHLVTCLNTGQRC